MIFTDWYQEVLDELTAVTGKHIPPREIIPMGINPL